MAECFEIRRLLNNITRDCSLNAFGLATYDLAAACLWENTPEIVFCIDPQGNVCQANPRALEAFSLNQNDLPHVPVDSLTIRQEDGQPFDWRAALATVDSSSAEEVVLNCCPTRGQEIDLRGRFFRLTYNEKDHLFCILSDNTRQAKKDRLFEALREKLHNLFYLSPSAICVTGVEDGRIYEANESLLRLSEYSEEEIVGNTTFALGTWASFGDRERLIELLKENGEARIETAFVTKSGKQVEGEINARMITTYEAQCFVSVFRDIGPYKVAERALRESERHQQLINKATNDAIWEWTLPDDRVWRNDSYDAFGYRPEEVGDTIDWWIGKLHPEDRERVVTRLYGFIDRRIESWFDKYRFERKDGSYAYIYDKGHILLNDEGVPYRLIGGMVDITERVMAEESILIKNKQIAEYSFFNSHKMRGPLARLMGLIEVIDRSPPEDIADEHLLEKLKAAAEEIDELVQNASRLLY